jgi:hypothetical protein
VDVYEQEFLGWFQTYMRGILALKEVFFGFLAFTTDWTERRTQKVEEVIRLANHHLGTRGFQFQLVTEEIKMRFGTGKHAKTKL